MTMDEIERLRVLMIEKFKAYQDLQNASFNFVSAKRHEAWMDYVELREQYLWEASKAEGKPYRRLECVSVN